MRRNPKIFILVSVLVLSQYLQMKSVRADSDNSCSFARSCIFTVYTDVIGEKESKTSCFCVFSCIFTVFTGVYVTGEEESESLFLQQCLYSHNIYRRDW